LVGLLDFKKIKQAKLLFYMLKIAKKKNG